ncbi:MAG: sensor domain-containing diguanylate cyclase [Polaromonas sp.]|nr:sensor domain-containing diguanylate cyclase [Polaromonas sp.]
MVSSHRVFHGRRLLVLLSLLLSLGFFATTLGSYLVSKEVIREAILGRELPLASSNIYVELQKDLVQPVVISSTMAHDTFLRDWVLRGERDVSEMNRYLMEVKTRHGAFSSFFVSDRSLNYYTGGGVLKKISPTEPRDAWYYRVRNLRETYEINVDPDLANQDAMTIFINYRVFDFDGNYLGATGIGLTMEAMHSRIKGYQQRYQRTIYFVNDQGQVVLRGQDAASQAADLHTRPGLRDIIDQILQARGGAYQYEAGDTNHLLNVHYIPELKWYLFVEKDESEALVKIRNTLYLNLGVCLAITLVVLMLTNLSLSRYQRRLEDMASTDKLTGMLNRHAFTILMDKLMADCARTPRPLSILMIDLDHFKRVNDQHGHAAGDQVLCLVAGILQQSLRKSDVPVRWGGEEFLVVLDNCALDEARLIAEKIRERIAQAHLDVDEKTVAMEASVGVSQLRPDEALDQAIQRADGGLYQAKQGGRNQVGVA